jgi:CheY-like chemotaxis protein
VKGRAPVVTAAILLVGDEPILLETRAELLKGWQVSTSTCQLAGESIKSRVPDLLIFCHSVPDETAEELIKLARELNPSVRALGICPQGETRKLNAEHYHIRLLDPGRLRTVVASLLESCESQRNVNQAS